MNEHVQTAKTELLFNPLAPEFIRDPYPSYQRLRTSDPMHLTPFGAFLASRHAEASLVLRDKRFGKDFVDRASRRYGPPLFRPASERLGGRAECLCCYGFDLLACLARWFHLG